MTDQLDPHDEPTRRAFAPPMSRRIDRSRARSSPAVRSTEATPTTNWPAAGRARWRWPAIAALFVWLAYRQPAGSSSSSSASSSRSSSTKLGHFMTAKWTGMKVTQFFLFFGPRLWSFRRGETEYGVRAIPLGAFVRIVGMHRIDDVDPADEARTYRQKSFPRRLLVISAGSIMHMLIAIVLLFGVYADAGRDHVSRRTAGDRRCGSRRSCPPARPASATATRSCRSAASPSPSSTELGEAVRSFEPGDVVDVVVDPRRRDRHDPGRARRQHDCARGRPAVRYGAARRVSRTARRSTSSTASSARPSNSVTDIFPVAWQSTQGIVKVLNPVNIVEPPHRHRTTTSASPADDALRRRDGVRRRRRLRRARRRAVPARDPQRVRRRVQHVPAAAARRRPRGDRRLRAGPGEASPAAGSATSPTSSG